MRRVLAIVSCAALLLAFYLAPFQHVHHGDEDHDHSPLVHSHVYALELPHEHDHIDDGPEIEAPHEQHVASPLDTYTVFPTPLVAVVFTPQVAVSAMLAPDLFAPVVAVESRTHDPPAYRPSIPRAPPV